MRTRFTMKPGESLEVTVVLPKRFASATTVVGRVGGRQAADDLDELHQRHRVHEVHPDDRSGRPVAAASAVIEIDDVFEARIACARSSASSLRKSSFFTPSFSTIASMARSAPAQSSSARRRARSARAPRRAFRCASFPFSTSLPSVLASLSEGSRQLRRGVREHHLDARPGRPASLKRWPCLRVGAVEAVRLRQ